MDYHQRVTLLAYYKQEKYGAYSPEKDTNTGYFDLVGSDRRYVSVLLSIMEVSIGRNVYSFQCNAILYYKL